MSTEAKFKKVYPYRDDVMALPVEDVSVASDWYSKHFGMTELDRVDQPLPRVILERDGVRIGFAVNGGDATQEGAAILVDNIQGIKEEFESSGINIGDLKIDERDGQKFQVFFVVAPDGLCYYFHEPV